MRKLVLALMCFGLFTCCRAVEDSNPLNVISEKNTSEDQLSKTTTTQYLELVNKYRLSLGLNPLLVEEDMNEIAIAHSQNMATGAVVFGHSGFSERCNKSRQIMGDGNLCGEIVAQGQKTAESVFQSWMGSSGHRAKLQEPRYTHTGFGYFKNESGVVYWTQIFLEVD